MKGEAGLDHDDDKLIGLDWFHSAANGRVCHLRPTAAGLPDDVNLLDVLEMIADCVKPSNEIKEVEG